MADIQKFLQMINIKFKNLDKNLLKIIQIKNVRKVKNLIEQLYKENWRFWAFKR